MQSQDKKGKNRIQEKELHPKEAVGAHLEPWLWLGGVDVDAGQKEPLCSLGQECQGLDCRESTATEEH